MTQAQIIKAHLMTGSTITTWQAYEQYGITCLAQRICDLRQAGIPIKSDLITHNGKRFNLYWLDTGYIQAQKAQRGDHE